MELEQMVGMLSYCICVFVQCPTFQGDNITRYTLFYLMQEHPKPPELDATTASTSRTLTVLLYLHYLRCLPCLRTLPPVM